MKSIQFDRKQRIIVLAIYAFLMFFSIINEIDTIVFILLFAVVPVVIYLFVLKIFPKKD